MNLVLSPKSFNDGKLLPFIIRKEGKKLPEGNFALYLFNQTIITPEGKKYRYVPLRFDGKLAMFRRRKLAEEYARYRLAID
jgi:hypothetical protein